MAKEFKSRPASPFETALHFIEHIGRHRAAKFYKPQQHTISRFWQTTNFDFLLISTSLFIALALGILGVIKLFAGFIGWLICSRSSEKTPATSQKESKVETLGQRDRSSSQMDENGNLLRKRK